MRDLQRAVSARPVRARNLHRAWQLRCAADRHKKVAAMRRPDVLPPAAATTTCTSARMRCNLEELFARTEIDIQICLGTYTLPVATKPWGATRAFLNHHSVAHVARCSHCPAQVGCHDQIERNNKSSICSKAPRGLLSNDTQCGR